MGGLQNRRLNRRWFEPTTCHQRKYRVTWENQDSRAGLI